MPTDLQRHINETIVVDTHEHMEREEQWLERPNDVLTDLFSNYIPADLISAGASPEAVQNLTKPALDIADRWNAVKDAFDAVRMTGYGEAVLELARTVYGIDDITPETIAAAQPRMDDFKQPGQRLRLLRDAAGLDHIQTDDFQIPCIPDESGVDFFMYDLSWWALCNAKIDVEALHKDSGVTVTDIASLRSCVEAIFEKEAGRAIAVKSQHAYNRTLRWEARSDEDAASALAAVLKDGDAAPEAARLCLGDWCWERAVEQCARHNLPFKHHTGYYAGTGYMITDRINAGNMCPLIAKHPDTKFVLMHTAYPYTDEMIAIVKHFPNCYSDMCWAWSINPMHSAAYVRRYLHAAPANKLFVFGGDTFCPTSAVAYTVQMRKWLARCLQDEIDAGDMTEAQAIAMASRLLRENQLAAFDVEGTRAAMQQGVAAV